MAHAIAWIFETLLRLLLPPSGRHRAVDLADDGPAAHQHPPTMSRLARMTDAPARPMAAAGCVNGPTTPFRPISGPPDRHGADMVRPCVVAHEQRPKSRPRVELVCAPHGMVVIR